MVGWVMPFVSYAIAHTIDITCEAYSQAAQAQIEHPDSDGSYPSTNQMKPRVFTRTSWSDAQTE
jgi:hypothetical protein